MDHDFYIVTHISHLKLLRGLMYGLPVEPQVVKKNQEGRNVTTSGPALVIEHGHNGTCTATHQPVFLTKGILAMF